MNKIEKILDMLHEGKISKDDAVKLIEAVVDRDKESIKVDKKRLFRISVVEDGKTRESLNVPISLLKFFLKTAKVLNKNYIEIEGQEIPIDINELENILNAPDFKGKLFDINSNEDGKNFQVVIEAL
ncbi:MAG: hypothetical protein K6343_06690 [Caldisericaceae bacterium]